jgi:hypothetical protein
MANRNNTNGLALSRFERYIAGPAKINPGSNKKRGAKRLRR